MVALYVGGQRVAWSEAERLLGEPSALADRVELRNDAGQVVARVVPEAIARDDDPDWVKAITPEAIAACRTGPFLTLEEYRKQQGQP